MKKEKFLIIFIEVVITLSLSKGEKIREALDGENKRK